MKVGSLYSTRGGFGGAAGLGLSGREVRLRSTKDRLPVLVATVNTVTPFPFFPLGFLTRTAISIDRLRWTAGSDVSAGKTPERSVETL